MQAAAAIRASRQSHLGWPGNGARHWIDVDLCRSQAPRPTHTAHRPCLRTLQRLARWRFGVPEQVDDLRDVSELHGERGELRDGPDLCGELTDTDRDGR